MPLDDFSGRRSYIEARTGIQRQPVQVAGRQVLPAAVEVEPGDDLLQQEGLREGRHQHRQPAAGDLQPSSWPPRKKLVRRRRGQVRHLSRRRRASSSSPGSTSTRCTRPRAAASSWSRTARRRSTPTAGKAVADFWQQLYDENLAGKETYNGDSFADGIAAMAIVGPWAIAVYKGKVDWGVVPVPTPQGSSAHQIHDVQRREERRACTPPARTAAPPGTS